MNYFAIALLAVTAAYLFHVGVIPSISDSYRTIKDTRVYHWFFAVSGVLIALQGVTTSERLIIPYVLTGVFFWFISLAAAFWLPREKWLHVIFTYTSIIAGLTLTVIRIWPSWGVYSLSLVVVMILAALWMPTKKNDTYWQEVTAYLIIFVPII
jgi:hypothetical protein